MAHINGQCAFRGCDRLSILEGYCNFHYSIISQQRNNQCMSKMVELLGFMNDRLSNIEDNLQNSPIPAVQTNNANTQTTLAKPANTFVPSINNSDTNQTEIRDLKRDHTTKDIRALADQLNNIK
jgi:hypothetical protein